MSDTINTSDNPQRKGKEWYVAQCVCEVCDAHTVSYFPACADDTALCCRECGHFTMVAVEYLDHVGVALLNERKYDINIHAHGTEEGDTDGISLHEHLEDNGLKLLDKEECKDQDAQRLVDGVFGDD